MGWGSFFSGIVDVVKDVFVDPIVDVVDKSVDIVEGTVKVGEKVVKETVDAIEDVAEWTYDVTESVVKTQFDLLVATNNLPQLLENPKAYFDEVTYAYFMSYAQPLGETIGDKQLAIEITYYAFIVAAIVASAFLTPAVSAAVQAALATIIEMIAAAVVLTTFEAAILISMYYGIGVLASSYIMSTINGVLLSIPADAYATYSEQFNQIYELIQAAEAQAKKVTNQYTSMYLDGTLNDWMAGGKMYDSPRAGNVLFNPVGNLNTVMFLGLENRNGTPDMVRSYANPEVSVRSFGALAGDSGFNVLNFGGNI